METPLNQNVNHVYEIFVGEDVHLGTGKTLRRFFFLTFIFLVSRISMYIRTNSGLSASGVSQITG